jgi:hypothetical protein
MAQNYFTSDYFRTHGRHPDCVEVDAWLYDCMFSRLYNLPPLQLLFGIFKTASLFVTNMVPGGSWILMTFS